MIFTDIRGGIRVIKTKMSRQDCRPPLALSVNRGRHVCDSCLTSHLHWRMLIQNITERELMWDCEISQHIGWSAPAIAHMRWWGGCLCLPRGILVHTLHDTHLSQSVSQSVRQGFSSNMLCLVHQSYKYKSTVYIALQIIIIIMRLFCSVLQKLVWQTFSFLWQQLPAICLTMQCGDHISKVFTKNIIMSRRTPWERNNSCSRPSLWSDLIWTILEIWDWGGDNVIKERKHFYICCGSFTSTL